MKGLKAKGVMDVSVKYMGGLRAMIVFKDEVAANNFLIEFNNLVLFQGQHFGYQKIALIKVEGVPVHIWDYHCFEAIGGLCGKV